MLASITPLGERGRQSHWTITVVAFLVGAVAAGALAGAVMGALGALTVGGISVQVRLAVLAVALAAAIFVDARRRGVPGPSRQVNKAWLDEYRGWVYGLGFGVQLGAGVATIVSSAATYVALLAALLSAGPAAGALIVGCAGAVRGAQPLASAWVRSPRQLMSLHGWMQRWRAPVARGALVAMSAALALAVIGSVA
jgi:hypothetical protein